VQVIEFPDFLLAPGSITLHRIRDRPVVLVVTQDSFSDSSRLESFRFLFACSL
jgi:hypothetical protein